LTLLILLLISLATPTVVHAEEPVAPEQLKKMYDDAMTQLQDAQARKSELAKENEGQALKIAEMQKDLEASQAQVTALQQELVALQQRTYALRSQQAIWQGFIEKYPDLKARWKLLLETDLFDPRDWPTLLQESFSR